MLALCIHSLKPKEFHLENICVLQNDQIPDDKTSAVVEHIVYVHLSVADYSKKFLQKWRRVNHVTPKNYLDFINSYTDLLKQKDKFFLDQVRMDMMYFHMYSSCCTKPVLLYVYTCTVSQAQWRPYKTY